MLLREPDWIKRGHLGFFIESLYCALLLDDRSIDLSGAQEKEGHYHYKTFLRGSK